MLSLPKLGRWFSWNDCAEEQIFEFWVSKMILEAKFLTLEDPDNDATSFEDINSVGRARSAAAELAAMRKLGGGLKLASNVMTTDLLEHATVLQVVTRSCWTWYTNQVKKVKSPKQGLQDALAATQGNWMRDQHLRDLIQEALEDHSNLKYMQVTSGSSAK